VPGRFQATLNRSPQQTLTNSPLALAVLGSEKVRLSSPMRGRKKLCQSRCLVLNIFNALPTLRAFAFTIFLPFAVRIGLRCGKFPTIEFQSRRR